MLSEDVSTMRDQIRNLSEVFETWWPQRPRKPMEIYENEFTACLEASSSHKPPKAAQPAMTAASIMMAALLRFAPRSLPADVIYEVREEDFVKLLRGAAKTTSPVRTG